MSRFDCGKMCAPLNGGEPVCCSTDHAIPIMDKAEYKLLRQKSDLWRPFRPKDKHAREVVSDMATSCIATECKGAKFCERDNRSLACRSFPFFPYLTAKDELIGLSYYWYFEDRCWVISNLGVADAKFVREFIAAYETLFVLDPEERGAFRDQSAAMRRTFSRWRRPIPLIGRDGGYFKILRGGRMVPTDVDTFRKHGPYRSDKIYARAVKEANAAAAT